MTWRSWVTEEVLLAPIHTHPGKVLRGEFMKRLGPSGSVLALTLALRVPATRVGDVLCVGRPRAMTADVVIKPSRSLGNVLAQPARGL